MKQQLNVKQSDNETFQNSNTDEELASVVDFMEDFKKNITLGLRETVLKMLSNHPEILSLFKEFSSSSQDK